MHYWSGVHYRIEADSPIEDLEKMGNDEIETEKRGIESKMKKIIKNYSKEMFNRKNRLEKGITSNALILHLDGDKRYTQKSEKYYKKLGLRAIVRNVPEYRQPQVIRNIDKKI